MATRRSNRGIRFSRLGTFKRPRGPAAAGGLELVGTEASLVPGPGPSVRLQLVHPDDPHRFVILDLVWDRLRIDVDPDLPRDVLLFRGWTGHPAVLVNGEVRDPDDRPLDITTYSDATERWTWIDQQPPEPGSGAPARRTRELAIWIPGRLAGAVQDWVNALSHQVVPSEIAVALASLMEGFFGEGGASAVQRGMVQLRSALADTTLLQ
jgi:hypothetical protein